VHRECSFFVFPIDFLGKTKFSVPLCGMTAGFSVLGGIVEIDNPTRALVERAIKLQKDIKESPLCDLCVSVVR